MGRRNRLAAALALAIIGGSGAAVAHAATASGTTYYVDNTVSTCSDAGVGTSATPFCTIQAAFGSVVAGDTVEIVAGTYALPATLSASGTATAPITVRFGAPGTTTGSGTTPVLKVASGSTPALTLSGADYVEIDDADVSGAGPTAVSVADSSHVTFSGGQLSATGSTTALSVSGSSSDVTVERATFPDDATAVQVDSGVTGTVITTDEVEGNTADAIVVDGASGTDVVSNEITSCDAAISVTSGASGTVIENNLVTVDPELTYHCTSPSLVGVDVDTASASGSTEKYDSFVLDQGTPIEWSGIDYSSPSAFQAATGQGAADDVNTTTGVGLADYVDDADANAPGELSTDFSGHARVDDPFVADTGTGVGYYDRGLTEYQDAFDATFAYWNTVAVTPLTAQLSYDITSGWAPCADESATIAWGDGQSTALSPCSASSGDVTHAFAKPSDTPIVISGTDGTVTFNHAEAYATAATDYAPSGPTRILDTRHGIGAPAAKVAQGASVRVQVAGTGSIPADAAAVAVNLTVTDATGNGFVAAAAAGTSQVTTSNLNYLQGQTVANAAVVPLEDGSIDIHNSGTGSDTVDLIADVTGYFSPGASSGYASVTPDRILDTRHAIGAPTAKVAGDTGLSLTVDGVDGVPASGVSAVALHVTAVDGSANGLVALEPDGAGVPTTSSLNYLEGQTVSNTVLVPVAADGKVELYNGGSGSVDLIADLAGYFSADATSFYLPLSTPSRVLDTRTSSSPLPSDASEHYWIGSSDEVTAVVANLTATDESANGVLTAYPDGVSQPTVSNLNYLKGQNVAGMSLLDTNSAEQAATNVYNGSTGTTDLIIDTFGYFATPAYP